MRQGVEALGRGWVLVGLGFRGLQRRPRGLSRSSGIVCLPPLPRLC